MISLLDIAERSQKGRKMLEDSWNMSLFHKISELVKRYDIPNYTSDTPFLNLDDELTGEGVSRRCRPSRRAWGVLYHHQSYYRAYQKGSP